MGYLGFVAGNTDLGGRLDEINRLPDLKRHAGNQAQQEWQGNNDRHPQMRLSNEAVYGAVGTLNYCILRYLCRC